MTMRSPGGSWSIRKKLALLLVLTSGISLLLAWVSLAAYDRKSLRRRALENQFMVADVMATALRAALAFSDAGAAEEQLFYLEANAHIVRAWIVDAEGRPFASYEKPGFEEPRVDSASLPDGHLSIGGYLLVARPIVYDGEELGTVFLQSEAWELQSHLLHHTRTVGLLLLGSSIVSLLIAWKLQAVVSMPILALTRAAARIGEGRLDTRIETTSDDEIGTLARGFNQMVTSLRSTTVSKTYLDNIVRSIADSLVVTDGEGRITRINEATSVMLGYGTEDLLRLGIDEVLRLDDVGAATKGDAGWSGSREASYRLADGSLLPVSVSRSALLDEDGELLGYVFVARDVRERKRFEKELIDAREAALDASRMKSEFLANMSHEIRTPMNGIIGMTHLALDTRLTDEQREYLEVVSSSADSLLVLLNDILDFSKIEAGKLDIDNEPFALRAEIASLLKPHQYRAERKGIALEWSVAESAPDDLVGDAARLRQVLGNLVSNAVKFTEAGRVELRVNVDARTGDDVTLHFVVEDTGVGIPASARDSIFLPFMQADGSTTRRFGGTGLGLAICRQLTELMGGRIWVESDIGVGSKFHLVLDFSFPQGPETLELPRIEDEEVEPVPPVSARILLAEDDAVNQVIAQAQLLKHGHRVRVVGTGEAAIQAFEEEPFDLILMDVQMPVVNGFEAAAAIRRIERTRGLDRTPIVGLTAFAQREADARCHEAGMDGCLSKPIRGRDLRSTVGRFLSSGPAGRARTEDDFVKASES